MKQVEGIHIARREPPGTLHRELIDELRRLACWHKLRGEVKHPPSRPFYEEAEKTLRQAADELEQL